MYQPSIRGIVAVLAVACLPFAVTCDAHAAPLRPMATITLAQNNASSWCLQGSGRMDCSFSNRAQCAATAIGNLGECVYIPPSAQPRD
jgi:hypothetical protein